MPAAVMPPGVAAAALTAAGSPSRAMSAAAPCTPATAMRCGDVRPQALSDAGGGEGGDDRGQQARHAAAHSRGQVELLLGQLDHETGRAEQGAHGLGGVPKRAGYEQEHAEAQGRRRRWA